MVSSVASVGCYSLLTSVFGGDPNHIVLSGDISGVNAIDILLTAPHYQLMEQGKFQKIPVIYGCKSRV